MRLLISFLLADLVLSTVLLLPLIPSLRRIEDETASHYTLYGSLWDLHILSSLRILAAFYALMRSYRQEEAPPETPFDPYHRNGEKKSRDELEEEALEEPFLPWLRRYTSRYSFPCEAFSLMSGVWLIVKCMSRLSAEIGALGDREPWHPLFWVALCLVAVASTFEAAVVESVGRSAGELGRHRRRGRRPSTGRRASASSGIISRISSSNLLQPLLSSFGGEEETENNDEEAPGNGENEGGEGPDDAAEVKAVSDIGGDAQYSAGWADLLGVCRPDAHLIFLAFVFLLFAATAQIYVPHYTGKVLDAVAAAYNDNKTDDGGSPWEIPGFLDNVWKLVIASILGGIFSGLRGGVFTVVGGRVNIRLRVLLLDSLLCQDIGFFDTTKTGHISSRLSSDTTLVGDQVTLNVNVFLRSLVQAVGVLIFMFLISWQLTLLAFISVPLVTVMSKMYGHFMRSLTKLMQKKLADGNGVNEAVISSMPTVRAFGAEQAELLEFSTHCQRYLNLNTRSAIAYVGYAATVTSLPQLVIAVVLFFGGLLVHSRGPDHISSGQLVTFLLYLSSLSDAFGSIGSVFASLVGAVGAADKVFELIKRKPKTKEPTSACSEGNDGLGQEASTAAAGDLAGYGICPKAIIRHRALGLHPPTCTGKVKLDSVEMHYPARPNRKILSGLTLEAPPGQVIALCGPSGGGKSSIVTLIQHLYEPSRGSVMIDGVDVRDLSYDWLSRNISIVSQEPTLFARSIERNIKYGLEGTDLEPTFEEIREAAELANAHAFIEALPHGYDTDVGERGVQLSGGQKQRIAISRALVRRPRILLLDEATSALDAESEAAVQDAIDGMLRREKEDHAMTVIVIAHRLSTIRNADKIVVIEAGQVVESGTHDDLIARDSGAYSNLVRKQMQAKEKLEGER